MPSSVAAEHDIAAAGRVIIIGVRAISRDHHIIDTIAIDVASATDCPSGVIAIGDAIQAKTIRTIQAGKGKHSRKVTLGVRIPAKHHVGAAGAIRSVRVGIRGPDNQIFQTVSIDIARRTDRLDKGTAISNAKYPV